MLLRNVKKSLKGYQKVFFFQKGMVRIILTPERY